MRNDLLARTDRPVVVDTARPLRASDGAVKTATPDTEAFLEAKDGTVYRLRWGKRPKDARALPAGTYRLRGYRITRKGWMISASGGHERVEIRSGKTLSLRLDARVRLQLTAPARRGQRTLRVAVRGHAGMGLSIYENGKRVPLAYRLSGRGGTLEEGPLAYG